MKRAAAVTAVAAAIVTLWMWPRSEPLKLPHAPTHAVPDAGDEDDDEPAQR
jgi:hypothetical protein